jgi:hypothetical protein
MIWAQRAINCVVILVFVMGAAVVQHAVHARRLAPATHHPDDKELVR